MTVNFECKRNKKHLFVVEVKNWKQDALFECPNCKSHTRWWKDGCLPDPFIVQK